MSAPTDPIRGEVDALELRVTWLRERVRELERGHDVRARQLAHLALCRPKGHFGSGRNAGSVKDSAPAYPTTRPDATKLLRAVEDAVSGVIWRDDSQIVDQRVLKRFGTPERCELAVQLINEPRETTLRNGRCGALPAQHESGAT